MPEPADQHLQAPDDQAPGGVASRPSQLLVLSPVHLALPRGETLGGWRAGSSLHAQLH